MEALCFCLDAFSSREPASTSLENALRAGKAAYPADHFLPALAHILECRVVLRRHEAGMHETKPCPAVALGESHGDDRVEPRAVLRIAVISALPRERQT